MIDQGKILEKILKRKLPCKIEKTDGIRLKENSIQLKSHRDESSKELYFQYSVELGEHRFILTEEYLFRDFERFLDIKRAISVNYYLKKED